LKRSTTFVSVPYSDSVYKTPKTHFDLLLLKLLHDGKTAVEWKQQGEGRRIHVSPVLHVGLLRQGREGEDGTEEGAEAAQGKEGSRRMGHSGCFIEKT
jgi:hypothetical protein